MGCCHLIPHQSIYKEGFWSLEQAAYLEQTAGMGE
jgi:hypothetical protein